MCLFQVLVDSLLSSDEEGDEGVERRLEGRMVCEASLCSTEFLRTGSTRFQLHPAAF